MMDFLYGEREGKLKFYENPRGAYFRRSSGKCLKKMES
jgi:hypothetical protein